MYIYKNNHVGDHTQILMQLPTDALVGIIHPVLLERTVLK